MSAQSHERSSAGVMASSRGPRRVLARAFCASVIAGQLYAVVHAYRDPLKRFGYQPFSESTEWQARIWAVDREGHKADVAQGFEGYQWSDLVQTRVAHPFRRQVASSGIAATEYFLRHALDYVAEHTPRDRRTHYLEADVSFRRNRGNEQSIVLRSKLRDVP